jgi:DNA-binding response OmpR family regulator
MPAIVAVATHPEDGCVRALRSGADDYVTYPFQTAELQARIDALMRRFQPSAADVIEAGDLRVDLGTREVTVAGRPIHLRPKEYDMFVYLLRRPRNVHSHRALLAALWGPAMQLRPHYVRMCVAHLRRQIEPQPESPCYIVTERAVGYRLQPSGGRHAA